MKYRHNFKIKSNIRNVAAFHFDVKSLKYITPPPISLVLLDYPANIKDGDKIVFVLKILFLSLRWESIIENIYNNSFQDRQIEGPYKKFIHLHKFVCLSENVTEVIDEITFELETDLGKFIIGLGMALTLPLLFSYRKWKTRKLLEKSN